jgi:hypothetical protein
MLLLLRQLFCCVPAGKDHSKVLDEHLSTVADKAKQFTAKVSSCVCAVVTAQGA